MRWAIMLVGALAVGACGPVRVPLGANQTLNEDYSNVLKAFTRKAETYHHFESRVFVDATYFAPAFVEAYARQRSERLGMTPGEAKAEHDRLTGRAAQESRFFLSVVTHDYYWNDLHEKKATMRTRLIVNGEAVEPLRIERLTDNDLLDIVPFFPYVTMLGRGYWAVFPRVEGSEVHLRIAGAPAIVDLKWAAQ